MTRTSILCLSTLLIALVGCGPPPQPQYRNSANPQYGQAELEKDQQQCDAQNSRTVMRITGYVEKPVTEVDQDKARACMAARGWQPAQK
jgi:hypothetical protein